MTNYELRPDVAGGFGEGTVWDRSTVPPTVAVLEYEFEGWAGDDLVTSNLQFLVTQPLADELVAAGITGVSFSDVTTSRSEQFVMFHPDVVLPAWRWMRVTGTPGRDDAWAGEHGRLTVSARFLEVLQRFDVTNCLVLERP